MSRRGVHRVVHTLKDPTLSFRLLVKKHSPVTLSEISPPVAKFPKIKQEVPSPLPSSLVQTRSLKIDDKLNEPLNLVSDPDTLCLYVDTELASRVDIERFLLTSAGFKSAIQRACRFLRHEA